MKKNEFTIPLLVLLALSIGLYLYPVAAQEPTQLVFVVDFSGTSDERDRDAALLAIATENARRAALDPENPDPLPTGTQPEIKSSLKTTLDFEVTRWFNSYRGQASVAAATDQEVKERWAKADDDERAAALAELPEL